MAVWVIQQPIPNRYGWVPDLSAALPFGEIRYIFPGGEQLHTAPQRTLVRAAEWLHKFQWKQDYLLWPNMGDPAAMWAVMLALAVCPYQLPPEINFLYWDRKRIAGLRTGEGFYTPVTFILNIGENHYGQKEEEA